MKHVIDELRDVQRKKQMNKLPRNKSNPYGKCLICEKTFTAANGINKDFALVKYFFLNIGPEMITMICDECGKKIESGNKLQFKE